MFAEVEPYQQGGAPTCWATRCMVLFCLPVFLIPGRLYHAACSLFLSMDYDNGWNGEPYLPYECGPSKRTQSRMAGVAGVTHVYLKVMQWIPERSWQAGAGRLGTAAAAARSPGRRQMLFHRLMDRKNSSLSPRHDLHPKSWTIAGFGDLVVVGGLASSEAMQGSIRGFAIS